MRDYLNVDKVKSKYVSTNFCTVQKFDCKIYDNINIII